MSQSKVLVSTGLAGVLLMSFAPAFAAACSGVSIGTASTNDVTFAGLASDQCVISTVNPQSGSNGDTSGFDSAFGPGAWSLLAKVTSSPTSVTFGGVGFNITFAQGSATAGSWSVTADKNVTLDLVFAMHAANRSGAFLFDDQPLVANVATPGMWTINWLNNGGQVPAYSNLTLFARDAAVTSIPEPGTYAMLLGGLGLMGFVARRRKI